MVIASARPGFRHTAVVASPAATVLDTFTRADNAAGLGIAETGQTWVQLGAATVQLTANKANPSAITEAIAVVDSGVADCTVQMLNGTTPASGTVDHDLYFRVVDVNNYWRFLVEGGVLYLQKNVAGTRTTVSTIAGNFLAGDTVAAVLAGSSITCQVNGVTKLVATDAFQSGATKHGIGFSAAGTSEYVDDFRVTRLV